MEVQRGDFPMANGNLDQYLVSYLPAYFNSISFIILFLRSTHKKTKTATTT